MAARRVKKNEGLGDFELTDLRRQLAEGKRPRVLLSGPQFPPGASGTISRIGDPETAGTDYITVRTKVNGVTDELAFAPAELSLRSRASSANAARPAPSPRKARPPRERLSANQSPPTAVNAGPDNPPALASPRPPIAELAAPARPAKSPATDPGRGQAVATSYPPATSVPTRTATAKVPATSAGSRRRKPAAPPKVSVTVSSSGASWTVSATRGPKAIVRNVSVPPGAITALADLLDQPALIEAVAEINETALAEAQDRAEQLRAELAQLEAVLATHQSPHSIQ